MNPTLVLALVLICLVSVPLMLVYRAVRRHDRMLVKRPDTVGWNKLDDPQAAQDRVVNRIIGAIGKSGHG